MSEFCFLFGHSDAPENITNKIISAIKDIYHAFGITNFVVGNRGNFDKIAKRAFLTAKHSVPQINLYLLVAYHPSERTPVADSSFDGILYPEGMEFVPKRLAIVKANQKMIETASAFILYVEHPGNSRTMLEKSFDAQKRIRSLS